MLLTSIKRDHKALVAIIEAHVEKCCTSVEMLVLTGTRAESSDTLRLCCQMKVVTRQGGDEGELSIGHEKILELINEHLASQGYHTFAQDHVFQGTPVADDCKKYEDLEMVFFVDLEAD